jgi:hypothetical protein
LPGDVAEHARTGFFKDNGLDMIRIDLEVAKLFGGVRIDDTNQ